MKTGKASLSRNVLQSLVEFVHISVVQYLALSRGTESSLHPAFILLFHGLELQVHLHLFSNASHSCVGLVSVGGRKSSHAWCLRVCVRLVIGMVEGSVVSAMKSTVRDCEIVEVRRASLTKAQGNLYRTRLPRENATERPQSPRGPCTGCGADKEALCLWRSLWDRAN